MTIYDVRSGCGPYAAVKRAFEAKKQVVQRRLRRAALADLVEWDIELGIRVAPDARTGKLRRISSRVDRPQNWPLHHRMFRVTRPNPGPKCTGMT